MPRPSPPPTRGNLWIDLVDDGWTTAEVAETVGLSQRYVQLRVAEARQRREAGSIDQDRPEVGDDDAEWLELIDGRAATADRVRGYYALDTDQTSHDGTGAFVWVGQGRGGPPRRNRLESGPHGTPAKDSTKYQPPNDGLKGGKG